MLRGSAGLLIGVIFAVFLESLFELLSARGHLIRMENGSCYQTGLRRFPHILLLRWVRRWETRSAMEVFVAKVAVAPV